MHNGKKVKGNAWKALRISAPAGEVALLDAGPRSADIVAPEGSVVAEILKADLLRVMDRWPRIGMVVVRNLAADLAGKIRWLDSRYMQE